MTGVRDNVAGTAVEAAIQAAYGRTMEGFSSLTRRDGAGRPDGVRLSVSTGAFIDPVIATGAYFKNAPCLVQDGRAIFSAAVGDLDSPAACARIEHAVEELLGLARGVPRAVAHDMHPDYRSTQVALALAARLDVPAIAVQHHHAHVEAILAENQHVGPALGLALDGTGLGTDGTAWGGELLCVDGATFTRVGHLRRLPLPGGDRAAREPWRMASAVLHLVGRGDEIATRFRRQSAAGRLHQVLDRPQLCPPTSSLGRWFDAVAGLLGVCEVMRVEAEAAIALEALATGYGAPRDDGDDWEIDASGQFDLLPLLERLADETDPARGAARLHTALVAGLEAWVLGAVATTQLDTVALSGGCFHNRILSSGLGARLRARGLRVLEARRLSPGDAGLALGQARVAAATLLAGF